ncbi:replication protein A 32 kDa subunit isoform X2 [Notamacropus eugenii]|uniref:replication protein A 32 kDa subunit isoform X2 n=1 Tax=Notamacropus eugenii TaxID=9315 RepID=UPI003B67D2A8
MWNSGFDGGYGNTSYVSGGYTQPPGGFGTPTASQAEKKSRTRAQHIVPCTISQLLSATLIDEVFKIGDIEISQVTIVGIIRQAEKAPTNIVYKIDDMTAAPMDVRQWVDTDDTSSENTVVPPETYVKVAGHLRSFQPLVGRPSLSTSGIGDPRSFGGNSFGGSSLMPANGLTATQNQVLNLIKACPRPEGMNFQDLKSQLHNLNVSVIKQVVDFLSNEGHIYSTVDDDHFKSTDAE